MHAKSPTSRLPATSSLSPATFTHADQLREPSRREDNSKDAFSVFLSTPFPPPVKLAADCHRGLRDGCYTTALATCHQDKLRSSSGSIRLHCRCHPTREIRYLRKTARRSQLDRNEPFPSLAFDTASVDPGAQAAQTRPFHLA